MIVRPGASVHGEGDHDFVPALIDIARATGVSAHIDAGANWWPAIHRQDAARIHRLALETAPAGAVFHAVAEEGVPTRAIAEVIGRHLDVEVVSIPAGQAPEHFGWLGAFAALNAPGRDARQPAREQRRVVGWSGPAPGLSTVGAPSSWMNRAIWRPAGVCVPSR